jgi:hypothetical protein
MPERPEQGADYNSFDAIEIGAQRREKSGRLSEKQKYNKRQHIGEPGLGQESIQSFTGGVHSFVRK